jgi:hypothetical protein
MVQIHFAIYDLEKYLNGKLEYLSLKFVNDSATSYTESFLTISNTSMLA